MSHILKRSQCRIIIVPGNGGFDVNSSNIWLKSVNTKLQQAGFNVVPLANYPDSVLARSQYWLPHIHKLMSNADGTSDSANTILIGHSSGCEAGMRIAETTKLYGLVLVSAYFSDLGDENEKVSGYFDTPWQWDTIRNNTKFIEQFASTDDNFVPYSEQQYVHEQLHSNLHKYNDRGHFVAQRTFDDLVDAVCNRVPE